jgi:hypothetical protein
MSIKIPAPPKDSVQALYSSLQRLPSGPVGGSTSLLLRDPKSLESSVTYPHKVYNVGLQDLVLGKLVEDAHLVSWRYLINQGNRGTASAEVNYDEAKGGSKFSEFDPGSLAAATLHEIRRVEQNPDLQRKSYELRLLRIPALYVTALWLKDTEGSQDVLIPIPPTFPALKPGEPYSSSQMAEILRQPAKKKLAFDSSPSPSREQSA